MIRGAPTRSGDARPQAPDQEPGPAARLLVVAPHPDDETIAAGGLLQRAQAAGARIQVWLLTDGDNNPWPQRWLERRWHLDAGARARWGARRREETAAALRQLGLEPARVLRAFGWPDGGITDHFIGEPAAIVSEIAANLRDFSPTDLVLPVAGDGHPDHGAAALLLVLALRQAGLTPRIRAYRIHGGRAPAGALGVALAEAEWGRKQRAVAAYATQAALTGPRLRHLAGRQEPFLADPFADVGPRGLSVRLEPGRAGFSLVCDLAWPHPALSGQRLLIVSASRGAPGVRVITGRELAGLAVRRGLATRLAVPAGLSASCETFVKLEPLHRGLWIYDRYPWVRLLAQPGVAGGSDPTQPVRPSP